MSNDGQPLGAPTANVTSPASRSLEFEDVDLYPPSATDVTSIDTSKDSLSNMTFLNTQANAQSAQGPGITEHQEVVKSILNNENANSVPFVRTPSPISLPSPGSIQLSRNEVANTGSRRDSATGDELSSRRDSSTRRNSDFRQDSNARQDSNSTNRDPDTRRNSYSRQNSDIGRDQTSRRSDTRQNSYSRKDSDPRESMRATIVPPVILRDEQHSTYKGSPLNPANSHEELRRSSRHHSSRMLPTPPPINYYVNSANPYSGMGAYATPQMYASPLPVLQYMIPPPVDYSHIYSPNIRPNSHLSPEATIPSATSPMYPSSRTPTVPMISPALPTPSSRSARRSVSSNIVAAAAMTPELKNMKSIMGSIAHPDTGSFADNNPYNLRSKRSRSTPDLQRPYSIPGPMSLPPGFQPTIPGPDQEDWYRYRFYPDEPTAGRAPSAAFSAPYNVTQGSANGFQSNSPWVRSAASATNSAYQHESHDSRHRSRSSRVDEPSQQFGGYEYYTQRQKTPADVVSAASSMPIPEKRGTYSFKETEPYSGSAVRRDTVSPIPETKATGSFAEHNPYRLPSRKPTLDAPTPPPIMPPPILPSPSPNWYQPRPSRRRSSSSSRERDYPGASQSSRRDRRRDEWDEKYRPSRSSRRSPSPEYYRPSRSRRRRRSYSPFKYGVPIPPVYPTMPYGTPESSFDTMPVDLKHRRHRSRRRAGFWYQFSNFFKSSFERGQPTTLQAPYPRMRSTEETPVTLFFIITVIIGQVYFHLLLRLPSLYFSRVSRIFDEANLNLYEITEMVFETAGGSDLKDKSQMAMNMQVSEVVAPKIRPQYERLKNSWESFIDSLIREWETFNIVSVMLLTAILTILQIGTAASDPVTRYAALFSLICALISLLFGCMYIIRFGTMRKTYAAVEWAKSALGSSQSVIWNVWVLLSMPAVWLTWSIILFIVAIMSFVWRTNPADDSVSTFMLSSTGLLVIRIAMSAVLGLGLVNALLITNTFQRYGEVLDKDWRTWINEWKKAKAIEAPLDILPSGNAPPGGYTPYLNYGQPLVQVTPLPDPGSVPQPTPIFQSGPYFAPTYPDFASQRASRRRRRRSSRYDDGSVYPDSESYSTTSESRSPRRRARRRPSSPVGSPQYPYPSPRDSPPRSHRYSQTPRIPDHDLPPHVMSPTPRHPTRNHPTHADTADTQNSNEIPDDNPPSHRSPFIPPPLISDNDEDHDLQNRVRFRSPLASARGSSDWGAYDSSFEYPSPDVIGPSSSSASGLTQESSNVQIQNSDALRRRRPT